PGIINENVAMAVAQAIASGRTKRVAMAAEAVAQWIRRSRCLSTPDHISPRSTRNREWLAGAPKIEFLGKRCAGAGGRDRCLPRYAWTKALHFHPAHPSHA